MFDNVLPPRYDVMLIEYFEILIEIANSIGPQTTKQTRYYTIEMTATKNYCRIFTGDFMLIRTSQVQLLSK